MKSTLTQAEKARRISDTLGKIAIIAVFAGCVEGLDGGLTVWTVICLTVAAVCGFLSKRIYDPDARLPEVGESPTP